MIYRDIRNMLLCVCLVIWSAALVPALAQGELDNENITPSFCCAKKPGNNRMRIGLSDLQCNRKRRGKP